ncbi:MAG: DUF4124 domain-containing protein [Lysobacter sp.]|nr:DUF4124 domain-containing protein [Lysobacter sp.]
MRIAFVLALLLATGWSADAHAGIVIYRCTDAFGRLTVQNDVPCPKGTRQQKQVVEPPPPMPAYRPPAPLPATPAQAEAAPVDPTPPPATPLPPPPLFRCHTPDNDSYLGENGTPAPRCLALPVVGLDGAPSAATACQMVADTCERIPDGAACDAWQQYARQAEAAWRFGRAEDGAKHQAEFERVQRVLRESTCAQAKPGA